MNILLTNDDGIDCEGLLKFAAILREQKEHRVYVLAPDTNRSGVSHSISFMKGPLRLSRYAEDMWSCSGTPADCVSMIVLGALPFKPDIVVSGINAGANVGTDIIYSGTAAAARQAGLYHIPGVALSLVGNAPFYWEEAALFAAAHLEEFAALWEDDIFINVNFPNMPGQPLGMVSTFPCQRRYHDSVSVFDAPDGRKYCFTNAGDISVKPEPGSDWDAVSRNLVSISPVFIHPVALRDQRGKALKYTGVDPDPKNLNNRE
jgi:5'-nucleotidase